MATDKNMKLLRRFAPTMVGVKPKVIRGKKCDNFNSGYAIIGERPNRLIGKNVKYDFERDIPDTTKTMLKKKRNTLLNNYRTALLK